MAQKSERKEQNQMKKHKSQSESQAKVAEEDEQKKFMQKIIEKYSRKQEKADSAKIKGD